MAKFSKPTLLPTALGSLARRPATRRYPDERREPYPGARGFITNDASRCILCGMCARVCPTGCIEVDRKGALWAHDQFACVQCGACAEACPTKSLTQGVERPEVRTERGRTELHPTPPAAKPKREPSSE
ncbi:MAG: 4Fe-4S binding protein [Desulfovibrionaceae bacterium]